jgi:hypothetical protein
LARELSTAINGTSCPDENTVCVHRHLVNWYIYFRIPHQFLLPNSPLVGPMRSLSIAEVNHVYLGLLSCNGLLGGGGGREKFMYAELINHADCILRGLARTDYSRMEWNTTQTLQCIISEQRS